MWNDLSGILLRVKEGSGLKEVLKLVLKFMELAMFYLAGLVGLQASVFSLGFG